MAERRRGTSPVQGRFTWEPTGVPQFVLPPTRFILWRMGSNLAACLAPSAEVVPSGNFAPMFRDSQLHRGVSARPVLASALLHVAAMAGLVSAPYFQDVSKPELTSYPHDPPRTERAVLLYNKADFLPAVSPVKEQKPPKPLPTSSPPREPRKVRAVQAILSRPPRPDNRRQRIIQPDLPQLQIPVEVPIPNMVYQTPVLVPPPPSPSEAQRQLAQIPLPHLPTPSVALSPPEPKLVALNRNLAEISVAAATLTAEPKLAVIQPSPSVTLSPRKPPQKQPAPVETKPVPLPAPPPPSVQPRTDLAGLPSLVAVGVSPVLPNPETFVPPGNRAGEFETAPQGQESDAEASVAAGDGRAPLLEGLGGLGQRELADIRVPHLSIAGDNSRESPRPPAALEPQSPPSSATPASPSPDLATLIAKVTRPSLMPELSRGTPRDLEPDFFGAKRVYTMYINMPNLSSASGSWVLRFAELDGKAAPQYEPAAVRDRVEGIVTLIAQILRDGSVANIRVLRSLDSRLDLSAIQALTRWQFEPARKDGLPIDLEVLVQIPFRLPAF